MGGSPRSVRGRARFRPRCGACLVQGRHKHGDKQRDNANDDEKLNERETVFLSPVIDPDSWVHLGAFSSRVFMWKRLSAKTTK